VLSTVAEPLDAVPPISVLADSIQGRLDDVLRLIAEHRLILATGMSAATRCFTSWTAPARLAWSGSSSRTR
jgi:hypothetical protein